MQLMLDALYPNGIYMDDLAKSATLVAGYIDHPANLDSYNQAVSRFPNLKHIKISIHGTVGAHVVDCEPGTHFTPSQCVPWAVASRKAGIKPTVYCNEESTSWGWVNVRNAFKAANVPDPMYWVANYNSIRTIPAGAHGHQFTDLDVRGINSYDASVMADGWPNQGDILNLDAEAQAFIQKTVADAFDAWTLEPSVVPPVDGKPQHYRASQALGNIVAFLWGNGTSPNLAMFNTAHKSDVDAAAAKVLAALKVVPNADVDETALANALVPLLVPALAAQLPQVSEGQLETALRSIFRSVPPTAPQPNG